MERETLDKEEMGKVLNPPSSVLRRSPSRHPVCGCMN
jgi:hypothetical protein